ncbi:hypothetical protein PYS61_00935 [Amygdalobacter indicium]|uniref:Uncharacterized protein n=1 Tax=Amygdalobacter indicium TaxID=3029272 RepID=A0ABY8C504_9FIRM|nr:hypothetical protein [Amygdalobacter indicium]WEG35758.1 hypothetical protein PYS61_00935 [Amygdalobacter indicium]
MDERALPLGAAAWWGVLVLQTLLAACVSVFNNWKFQQLVIPV